MELCLLVFLIAIVLAAITGRVSDSRDGADWRPSDDGQRRPPGRT
jgi:hypothetical protein